VDLVSRPPVPDLLFAYGTLGPAGPEAIGRDGWAADAVRGRLFDLGTYPVLVDWDVPGVGWVEGYVRPVGPAELEGRLDAYEGVDEGLYRRIAAPTRAGRWAWVYAYPHPLPPGARGPLTRWEGLPSESAPSGGRPEPDKVAHDGESHAPSSGPGTR